ncbi:MAG: hypothetical protein ACYS9T_09470 [Planctomycetota bacterium]
MKDTIVAFICALVVLPCQAQIITIDNDAPADFNNTQVAIKGPNDGDVIEVKLGTETD